MHLNDMYNHCDTDDSCITLHDCYANHITVKEDGISLCFEDGFWVTPNHIYNELDKTVRTDSSRVDFCFEKETLQEIIIYVFRKNIFGRVVRTELILNQFVDLVNNKAFSLEFLYQYKGDHAQIYECYLHFDKPPYCYECQLKLPATTVKYYWNNLCAHKEW